MGPSRLANKSSTLILDGRTVRESNPRTGPGFQGAVSDPLLMDASRLRLLRSKSRVLTVRRWGRLGGRGGRELAQVELAEAEFGAGLALAGFRLGDVRRLPEGFHEEDLQSEPPLGLVLLGRVVADDAAVK